MSLPPQHGKSEAISKRLPAYTLGKNPDKKIVNVGYNHTFISKFNVATQRIIDDELYRQLFPKTTISGKYQAMPGNFARNVDQFEIVGHKGSYTTVGVGGGLTGHSVDIAIIDDPIKDSVEANSEVTREKIWEWFNTVLMTRLHNESQVLIVMTRWHEDDLIGRLLQIEPDRWESLVFQAIKDEDAPDYDQRQIGEPLWPDKHSLDTLLEKRKVSPRTFQSLYQQNPTPSSGNVFQKEWFKFCDMENPKRSDFDKCCTSWDMTFKDNDGSDYVVGLAMGLKGADIYVFAEVRRIMNFPDTLKAFMGFTNRYSWIQARLVEDKANGPAVIATLGDKIGGIIPINPEGSKEARAHDASALCESGNVYLPDPHKNPWVEPFINELCTFPNGRYDDRVDAFSQGVQYLKEKEDFGFAIL